MQTRVITYTRSQPEVVVRMTRDEATRIKQQLSELYVPPGPLAELCFDLASALEGPDARGW